MGSSFHGLVRTWLLSSGIVIGGALVACGSSSKPATDPSATTPTSQDEVPKWEGASAPEPPKTEGAKGDGPARPVNEAPTRRTDQYDKEGTEIVLKRQARQVKGNCGAAKDENGKATGPWGKVTIQVQLGHNGHSKGVTVPPPYQGKPTGNCIEKAFQAKLSNLDEYHKFDLNFL